MHPQFLPVVFRHHVKNCLSLMEEVLQMYSMRARNPHRSSPMYGTPEMQEEEVDVDVSHY